MTEDVSLKKQWDWFLIGWQPVFVDYTKPGTWFVMVLLCEVTWLYVLRCVVRMVDAAITINGA